MSCSCLGRAFVWIMEWTMSEQGGSEDAETETTLGSRHSVCLNAVFTRPPSCSSGAGQISIQPFATSLHAAYKQRWERKETSANEKFCRRWWDPQSCLLVLWMCATGFGWLRGQIMRRVVLYIWFFFVWLHCISSAWWDNLASAKVDWSWSLKSDFHTSVPRGSGTKANTAHSYCCRRVFTADLTLFIGAGSPSVWLLFFDWFYRKQKYGNFIWKW